MEKMTYLKLNIIKHLAKIWFWLYNRHQAPFLSHFSAFLVSFHILTVVEKLPERHES